jgi:hypothetical protein
MSNYVAQKRELSNMNVNPMGGVYSRTAIQTVAIPQHPDFPDGS